MIAGMLFRTSMLRPVSAVHARYKIAGDPETLQGVDGQDQPLSQPDSCISRSCDQTTSRNLGTETYQIAGSRSTAFGRPPSAREAGRFQ
jgi:hypothetical protein